LDDRFEGVLEGGGEFLYTPKGRVKKEREGGELGNPPSLLP